MLAASVCGCATSPTVTSPRACGFHGCVRARTAAGRRADDDDACPVPGNPYRSRGRVSLRDSNRRGDDGGRGDFDNDDDAAVSTTTATTMKTDAGRRKIARIPNGVSAVHKHTRTHNKDAHAHTHNKQNSDTHTRARGRREKHTTRCAQQHARMRTTGENRKH